MLCFSKRHRLPTGGGGRVDGFKTIDVLDRGGARELYFNFIFEWVQDCGCPLNLRPETPKPKP